MTYLDGFVAAVPTADRDAYVKHCQVAGSVFKEHGALTVVDCWGGDVPEGKLTSFPMAVKCQADETVGLGWITWPSRVVRDAGMKRAMENPRLRSVDMPFDGKRMIFGGFEVVASA